MTRPFVILSGAEGSVIPERRNGFLDALRLLGMTRCVILSDPQGSRRIRNTQRRNGSLGRLGMTPRLEEMATSLRPCIFGKVTEKKSVDFSRCYDKIFYRVIYFTTIF